MQRYQKKSPHSVEDEQKKLAAYRLLPKMYSLYVDFRRQRSHRAFSSSDLIEVLELPSMERGQVFEGKRNIYSTMCFPP